MRLGAAGESSSAEACLNAVTRPILANARPVAEPSFPTTTIETRRTMMSLSIRGIGIIGHPCFARLPALAMLAISVATARAEVKLPHLISDHAIFQRDMPVRVWGWAAAGENVRVSIAGKAATATTDRHGNWQVELPAIAAGGPYDLTVDGKNHLVVHDILVGEVWIAAGQSNMEYILVKSTGGDAAVRQADFPRMRLFTVPRRLSKQPQNDVDAEWKPCSPKTVSWFSAVAFYFGRELHRELKVPVGLVASAYGGTRIEPWTPAAGVAAVDELRGKDRAEDGELYNGMIHALTPLRVRGESGTRARATSATECSICNA